MTLDHIGELPEVRLYLDSGKHNFMIHGFCRGFGIRYIRESNADAALAAADREVGRLKCCGNCHWMHCDFDDCTDDVDRELLGGCSPADPCHFTPSRWTGRRS